MSDPRPTTRPRVPGDLARLLELLIETHRQFGYPVNPSRLSVDFIAGPGEIGAWVAEWEGAVLGHVSLLPPHGLSAPLWRAASERGDDQIAVISRLFSHARGAGSALLSTAVAAARAQGLAPVLEVERDSPALGFYLRRGWISAGELEQTWREPPVPVVAMVLPGD